MNIQPAPFSYLFNGYTQVSSPKNSNNGVSDPIVSDKVEQGLIEPNHVSNLTQQYEQLINQSRDQSQTTNLKGSVATSFTTQDSESEELVYTGVASAFSMSKDELLELFQSEKLKSEVSQLIKKLFRFSDTEKKSEEFSLPSDPESKQTKKKTLFQRISPIKSSSKNKETSPIDSKNAVCAKVGQKHLTISKLGIKFFVDLISTKDGFDPYFGKQISLSRMVGELRFCLKDICTQLLKLNDNLRTLRENDSEEAKKLAFYPLSQIKKKLESACIFHAEIKSLAKELLTLRIQSFEQLQEMAEEKENTLLKWQDLEITDVELVKQEREIIRNKLQPSLLKSFADEACEVRLKYHPKITEELKRNFAFASKELNYAEQRLKTTTTMAQMVSLPAFNNFTQTNDSLEKKLKDLEQTALIDQKILNLLIKQTREVETLTKKISACFETQWFGRRIDLRNWRARPNAQKNLIAYLGNPNCKVQEIFDNGFFTDQQQQLFLQAVSDRNASGNPLTIISSDVIKARRGSLRFDKELEPQDLDSFQYNHNS